MKVHLKIKADGWEHPIVVHDLSFFKKGDRFEVIEVIEQIEQKFDPLFGEQDRENFRKYGLLDAVKLYRMRTGAGLLAATAEFKKAGLMR